MVVFLKDKRIRRRGFTIVELLIVIVVIAILATITIVAYNGVNKRAAVASLQSDLAQNANLLNANKVDSGLYPLTSAITPSTYFKHAADTKLEYTSTDGTSFCLTASSNTAQDNYYFDSTVGKVQQGKCTGHTGYVAGGGTLVIQTVTSANCPTSLTMTVDARDNHTYWVKKLADGKCWMLTNLAYAGGGANTYGDVIPVGDGTPGSPRGTLNGPDNSGSTTYTLAKYYIPTGPSPTSDPTNPSTDQTGGSGAGIQYGYLYNWCAAMGGQATSACANAVSPTPDTNVSVCPAGWRLPTGGGGSEFAALNTSINGGSTSSPAGLLSNGYFQYAGLWYSGFIYQGSMGYYWSSTIYSSYNANMLSFYNASVYPASSNGKINGFSVRCVAN